MRRSNLRVCLGDCFAPAGLAMTLSGLEQFLDALASADAIPGGGSSAALAGAMAAGLVGMVCRVTMKNPPASETDALNRVINRADELRGELMTLIELDGESYRRVLQAYKTKQPEAIHSALVYATEIPMRTGMLCGEILTLAARIAPIARRS